jgi:Tol biopolymer transport system component
MNRTLSICIVGLAMIVITAEVNTSAGLASKGLQAGGKQSASSQASQRGSTASVVKQATETIVYSTFRRGNWDITYFPGSNNAPRKLINDPGLEYDAVFSPDGRWVVFCSERRANPDLYVIDLHNPGPPKLLIDSDAMEDQAAISPDGKTMAFVCTRDGTADIFLIPFYPEKTQDMNKAKNLTNHKGGEFRPSFSPDGRKIAFSTDWDVAPTGLPNERFREGEVYVMNADGTSIRRLTYAPGWDGSPVWSSDGRTIYFYSKRDGEYRIWSMDSQGADARPVSPKGLKALSPALTPEGRIAFAAQIGDEKKPNWKILSVKPDGSDKRMESDALNDYYTPAISKKGAMLCHGPGPIDKSVPQGEPGLGGGPLLVPYYPRLVQLPDRRVALYAFRDFSIAVDPTGRKLAKTDSSIKSHYLAITELDGSNEQIIFNRKEGGPPVYVPAWSKDGEWVAWMAGLAFRGPEAESDIWKVRPDGSGAVNLTPNTPGNDGLMSFSGDGKYIVFRSGRTGNFDIYIMNSDGSNVRNLTSNPAYDSFPAFSPLSNQIAFASNREGDLDEKTGVRTFELYTLEIKPDGSAGTLRRVTDSPGQDSHPSYSPDGKWLVFVSERGGINDEEPIIFEVLTTPQAYGEVYAIRLEDGYVVRLTHNKWEDGLPSWGGPHE